MATLPTDTRNNGGSLKGIRGPILTFKADPFIVSNEDDCYDHYTDGLIVMQDGRIVDVGDYRDTAPRHPALTEADIDRYGADSLIMPGFVDCHLHYVQSPMIGSYGDTLLNWLNRYTFPTESKFRDKEFADEVARIFFRQLLEQGTTTANVFSTTFAASVDAFFEESERYNTRMITGKVLQDRNLPDSLRDRNAEESVFISEELLKKWHHRGRQLYAVIPRFAPTSTPLQLRLAGDLYRRYIDQGVYMHTHLDEAESEIAWVKELYPDFDTYTDVYRHFGLVDRMSVFAHCCIVRPEEWDVLHKSGCGVAHCPSSNLFLGDGEFKYWEAKESGRAVHLGIGTDVGGGTNFSVPRQLGEAYKVAMLRGRSLNALRSFYLATRGGAETLRLDHTIGSIAPGYEADIAVLDMEPSEFAAWRLKFADSIFDRLFILMTLGLDNLNKATYVAGKKVFDRHRADTHLYAADL
ncbi:MAG: guanine deaminase [Bacteroidales bacterium]|nr:guanine deaminase [Bacteroidales bacterium]